MKKKNKTEYEKQREQFEKVMKEIGIEVRDIPKTNKTYSKTYKESEIWIIK